MSMTFDEVAELLAFCAVHDKRKGDELDVNAWLLVANDHDWTASAALRVAREHYGQGEGRPRLEAAAITDRIREIRKRAAATFVDPVIPDGLSNADYPAWYRRLKDAHRDALVEQWALSGTEPPLQLPPGPPPNEIGQRRVAGLLAGAFHEVPPAAPKPQPDTDGPHRRGALIGSCPYCQARDGEPCTRSGANGRVRLANPHPARLNAQEAS